MKVGRLMSLRASLFSSFSLKHKCERKGKSILLFYFGYRNRSKSFKVYYTIRMGRYCRCRRYLKELSIHEYNSDICGLWPRGTSSRWTDNTNIKEIVYILSLKLTYDKRFYGVFLLEKKKDKESYILSTSSVVT